MHGIRDSPRLLREKAARNPGADNMAGHVGRRAYMSRFFVRRDAYGILLPSQRAPRAAGRVDCGSTERRGRFYD